MIQEVIVLCKNKSINLCYSYSFFVKLVSIFIIPDEDVLNSKEKNDITKYIFNF
jgi:hypothetical protein